MQDIDFVITWVDGTDPDHAAKVARYRDGFESDFHTDEATSEIRWQDNREITYLLRSIERYAPWVRRIWIVTDKQSFDPEVSGPTRAKIGFVDHTEIFRGYEEFLPTFNSIAIASMLWRIPGLAENFVYFNDDVFIGNHVRPSDFFHRDGIICRGGISAVRSSRLIYFVHKRNALDLVGADRGFSNAHVAISAKTSIFRDFFTEHPEQLLRNISHRFRHEDQFSAFALATLIAQRSGRAYTKVYKDFHHFNAGMIQTGTQDELERQMNKVARPHILLGCINDAATLSDRGINWENVFETGILARRHTGWPMLAALRGLPKRRVPSQFAPG